MITFTVGEVSTSYAAGVPQSKTWRAAEWARAETPAPANIDIAALTVCTCEVPHES